MSDIPVCAQEGVGEGRSDIWKSGEMSQGILLRESLKALSPKLRALRVPAVLETATPSS